MRWRWSGTPPTNLAHPDPGGSWLGNGPEIPRIGGMVPIVGASTPDQIRETADIVDVALEREQLDWSDQARGDQLSVREWPVTGGGRVAGPPVAR